MKVHHIQQKFVVPHSLWQNLSENSVRHLKQGIRRATCRRRSPKRIWYYCGQRVAAIRRLTALDIAQLDEQVPEEFVLDTTPDISVYSLFDWYEYVYYWNPIAAFSHEKNSLVDGLEFLNSSLLSWPDLYSQTPAKLSYVSLYGAFQMKINNLLQPKLQ